MTDELIERLEKATGPDRELDGEIFEVVGGAAWKAAYARAQEPCGCPHETAVAEAKRRAPAYSASLDAALTLVPEGWEWEIGGDVPSESGEAHVFGKGDEIHTAFVDSPAIALCIAALKARSVSQNC